MKPYALEGRPLRPQLRHFGWLLAMTLALAASRVENGPAGLTLKTGAAVLFTVATVWPGTLRWPYRIVMVATAPARWVTGRVLLVLVYYGLLTPLAVVLRLLRRDVLRWRLEPQALTYWQPRPSAPKRRRYLRPL